MSQIEDPATTIARLLRTQMRVVKNSGALASIEVSDDWKNSDAFKSVDGQVTVGLAECSEQKIDLTGRTRLRLSILRVNVWATDTSNTSEMGKSIRKKIVTELIRIIKQNCTNPNATIYNFVGLGAGGQEHKAFSVDMEVPASAVRAELSDGNYQKLWYSDNNHCQIINNEAGKSSALLLRFKIDSPKNTVKQATFAFEGFATSSGGDGVTVKGWNHTQNEWQNPQSNQASAANQTLTLTLTGNLEDFIDDQGYIWFLAKTNGSSDGNIPAVLQADYASCTVTVNGVTYCDLVSYRNLDRFDVKPAIYRTELIIKSWFIENTGE